MAGTERRSLPEQWRWFPEARFGIFIHWGAYAQYGRGEQVLFREHLDQREYIERACAWNPQHFDARIWAETIKNMGAKYAVLTTRHHDGYCLWDSKYTDYSSGAQAPKRDFVAEYVEAFRAAGLRVGLYYSWIDWRVPAYFDGPAKDPAGWERMRTYIHNQVEELLTNYGRIDVMWFDGVWPRNAEDLKVAELVEKIRAWQPGILINNRLDTFSHATNEEQTDGGVGAGGSAALGDFGTPEHEIVADPNRLWESCQVVTWRLWCHSFGERWRPTDVLLDMLCQCAHDGGNLLLNVGPMSDGRLPPEFFQRAAAIGEWLAIHGEAIYGTEGGDVTEFVTRGWQTVKDNNLYLIIRFWDGQPVMRLADLVTPVKRAVLLTTGQELEFEQDGEAIIIKGLPKTQPTPLFPVIKLTCEGKPAANQLGRGRLWCGDPARIAEWARTRGTSVFADGKQR